MPFQSLRPNSPIYVLHKGDTPSLSLGTIETVSQPFPTYNSQRLFGQTELHVDVTAQVEGQTMNFKSLPAFSDIADSDTGYVVACNREQMADEVEAMKRVSESIIASVERHKGIISKCNDIISTLRPAPPDSGAKDAEIERQGREIEKLTRMVETLLSRNERKGVKDKSNDND